MLKNNMKGILHKTERGWFVKYKMESDLIATDGGLIPLHPKDIELMPLRGQLPNDQHVMDGMEVDFHFTEKWYEKDGKTIVDRYAKITPQEQKIYGEHQITVLEISDEEIYKASHQEINHGGGSEGWIKAAFRQGAVWYREQLKQLNEE